jgi:hypothetical protein
MQTQTKWILGGVAAAGVLYLFWPKTASAATAKLPSSVAPATPGPLVALAAQPGALLVQPDPNTMLLSNPANGNWGVTYDEVASLGGHEVLRVQHSKSIYSGSWPDKAVLYPSNGPPPPPAAVVGTLAEEYGAVLPTQANLSNPQGGVWTAAFSATINQVDNTGNVTTITKSDSIALPSFPSSGPAPGPGDVDNAVYQYILNNL